MHSTNVFPSGQVCTVLSSSMFEVLCWQLAYQLVYEAGIPYMSPDWHNRACAHLICI